jgi:hypothetical protein
MQWLGASSGQGHGNYFRIRSIAFTAKFAVDLPAHIWAPAMAEGFNTAHLMIATNQKNHTSKHQLVQPMRKCLQ